MVLLSFLTLRLNSPVFFQIYDKISHSLFFSLLPCLIITTCFWHRSVCLKPYDSESFHPLNNTAPPNVVSGEEESSSHLVPLRGRETKTGKERVLEGINSFRGKDTCVSLLIMQSMFLKTAISRLKKKVPIIKKEIFIVQYKKGRKKALFLRLLFVLVEGLQAKRWTPSAPPPTGGLVDLKFVGPTP